MKNRLTIILLRKIISADLAQEKFTNISSFSFERVANLFVVIRNGKETLEGHQWYSFTHRYGF